MRPSGCFGLVSATSGYIWAILSTAVCVPQDTLGYLGAIMATPACVPRILWATVAHSRLAWTTIGHSDKGRLCSSAYFGLLSATSSYHRLL